MMIANERSAVQGEGRMYQALFESAVVGLNIVDADRRVVACNDAYCRILGRPREDVIGRLAGEFTAAGTEDAASSAMEQLVAGEIDSYSVDKRYARPDGTTVPVRVTTSPIGLGRDWFVGVVQDLTDRRAAEREAERHAALLASAQRIGRVGIWVWDARTNRTQWSAEARAIFGLGDATDGDPELFWQVVHPEDAGWLRKQVVDAFNEARPVEVEHRVVVDGEVRWLRVRAEVERDEDGTPARHIGVVIDVTASRRAQEELAEQAEALRRAHELALLGRFTVDIRKRTVTFTPEVARMLGAAETELVHDAGGFRERFVHEDDAEHWAREAERVYATDGPFGWESRMRRADGHVLWVRVRGRTERDDGGRPFRAVGVVQDVTEHHALEEKLLQAQKLEAVGQLAAGVAHDFNNLLTVIVGNTELALTRGGSVGELSEVLRAANRASDLVRQLLAFSRADSTQTSVVELNDAVRGVRRMLERLIEEHIRVQATLIEAETPVLADPGQLEQVLLNLAVNARDAMPDGGLLTISTRSDRSTVTLEVSDTGHGMDDATRARVFDPFYTTKRPGEGTGLGLSTVYGIVTRAGGSIDVRSELGAGTTFTITFPRATPAPAAGTTPGGGADRRPRPHTGRVLVVEDDEMVRAVAAQSLIRAGYDVVATTNGEEALAAVESEAPFDLMVTDLMMPTITGVQLTAELEARGHSFPVLYTSGYPRAVTEEAPRGPRAEFLPKPFSSTELTTVVRRLLDVG
jgi:two-component system, cell cycle sensor histidine kinase and response regulator CckA